MMSTACPECRQAPEQLGQRDGSCNPGCPNAFRAEHTPAPILPLALRPRRRSEADHPAPIDFLNV